MHYNNDRGRKDHDSPSESKERIVLPSSVSRVVMKDAVPIIRTDIVSTSNLNVVAAAAATEDDNNLNTKFHLECENLVVDLDSIQQEDSE